MDELNNITTKNPIDVILDCCEDVIKNAECEYEKTCAKEVAFKRIYILMRGEEAWKDKMK